MFARKTQIREKLKFYIPYKTQELVFTQNYLLIIMKITY